MNTILVFHLKLIYYVCYNLVSQLVFLLTDMSLLSPAHWAYSVAVEGKQ